jgi:hypothetical protein
VDNRNKKGHDCGLFLRGYDCLHSNGFKLLIDFFPYGD